MDEAEYIVILKPNIVGLVNGICLSMTKDRKSRALYSSAQKREPEKRDQISRFQSFEYARALSTRHGNNHHHTNCKRRTTRYPNAMQK